MAMTNDQAEQLLRALNENVNQISEIIKIQTLQNNHIKDQHEQIKQLTLRQLESDQRFDILRQEMRYLSQKVNELEAKP